MLRFYFLRNLFLMPIGCLCRFLRINMLSSHHQTQYISLSGIKLCLLIVKFEILLNMTSNIRFCLHLILQYEYSIYIDNL